MRLVILDRDGVINEDSDAFIKTPDEWHAIPGSLEAIARLHQAGFKVFVLTNQSGLARKLFDMDMLNRIHHKMIDAVRHKGGEIDGVLFCPHGPDAGCACRKPGAGLFLELAERLKINLTGVYAVGDSGRDLVAARSVGALPILLRTGKGERTLAKGGAELAATPVFADLAAFADALLQNRLSPEQGLAN